MLQLDADDFMSYLVELAVKHALPLTTFEEEWFKRVNGRIAAALNVTLDVANVRAAVLRRADEERSAVMRRLRGRQLFVKFDECSSGGGGEVNGERSFAVHARFAGDRNGKVEAVTLATRKVTADEPVTPSLVREIVENVLEDFGVRSSQVLGIVTDITSAAPGELDELPGSSGAVAVGNGCEEEKKPAGTTRMISPLMTCASQTLDCAVDEGLQERSRTLLNRVAVKHRASRPQNAEEIGGGWLEEYLLCKRLLETKSRGSPPPRVDLTEDEWKHVGELEVVLRYPYAFAAKMSGAGDNAQMTPGDFCRSWTVLEHGLRTSVECSVARAMIRSLEYHGAVLMKNELMLAAVYVDPGHRAILNAGQVERAKKWLLSVAIAVAVEETSRISASRESGGKNKEEEEVTSAANASSSDENSLSVNGGSGWGKSDINLEEPGASSGLLQFKAEFFKQSFTHFENLNGHAPRKKKETLLEEIVTGSPHEPVVRMCLQRAALTVTALPCTRVSTRRRHRFIYAQKIISSVENLKDESTEDDGGDADELLLEASLFLRLNDF